MTFPNNCSGNLGNLKNSPIFAMSLGAKELFHTNFLAFLLESQDPLVTSIQSKLKCLLFGHDRVGRVITWREKESLDLVIMPAPKVNAVGNVVLDYDCQGNVSTSNCVDHCNTIAVVIEAKLKSIPTTLQLDGYDVKLVKGINFELNVDVSVGSDTRTLQVMKLKLAKNKDDESCNSNCTIEARGKKIAGGNAETIEIFSGTVRRLLLRPMRKSIYSASVDLMGCWEQMSWQCVVDALKCDRHDDPCDARSETTQLRKCKGTALLPSIICDYRESLEQLLSILNQTDEFVKSSVGMNSEVKYGEYYQAITDKRFKVYRIHDFVGKYASHILERYIMDFVCGALANISGNGQFVCCNLINFELNSYMHFSNQLPGVGFEWLATNNQVGKDARRVSFGVQIQDKAYRHFICVEGGEKKSRDTILGSLQTALAEPPDWFGSTSMSPANSLTLAKKSTKNNSNQFYAFSQDVFRYTKADIFDLPMLSLAQVVYESLHMAKQIVSKSQELDCTVIATFLRV